MNSEIRKANFSLLTVIVSRSKGSRALKTALSCGALEASCFLGKGTIPNTGLHMLEMNEVHKEIILAAVKSSCEQDILDRLSDVFHFERPNSGIAFTMPVSEVVRFGKVSQKNIIGDESQVKDQGSHGAVLLIVNKEQGQAVIDIAQKHGYFGGTIIKARGSASALNVVLDMLVEPEKEVVLMVTEREQAHSLAEMLYQTLELYRDNTGIIAIVNINKTAGLHGSGAKEKGGK